MKTREEIREWVEGQFYSDRETKQPCEDYENWGSEYIEENIESMYKSLCKFMEDSK